MLPKSKLYVRGGGSRGNNNGEIHHQWKNYFIPVHKWYNIESVYANEPGFENGHFLLNLSTYRDSRRRRIRSKLGKTLKSRYWLVWSSQKIGFEIRKWARSKPGSFAYIQIRGYIICLPSYGNIFFFINSNYSRLVIDWYSCFNFCFLWSSISLNADRKAQNSPGVDTGPTGIPVTGTYSWIWRSCMLTSSNPSHSVWWSPYS